MQSSLTSNKIHNKPSLKHKRINRTKILNLLNKLDSNINQPNGKPSEGYMTFESTSGSLNNIDDNNTNNNDLSEMTGDKHILFKRLYSLIKVHNN